MTPDELRRLAEEWHECCGDIHVPLLAAADALEKAWAERDYERSLRLGKGGAMDAFHREYERAERAEAELAFQRKWCADNLGLMPPTREQNDTFLAALEGDAGVLTREQEWAEMTEPLHHDENTMVKVFHALRAAGLDKQRCFDAITEMQNAGILFRERSAIDEEGGGR